MKKGMVGLMTLLMLFVSDPLPVKAATEIKKEVEAPVTNITQEKADVLVSRLHEIHQMDKSDLNSLEKEALRNEVLTIKDQLADNPVIVISGTTLLLIIIILILL